LHTLNLTQQTVKQHKRT